MFLSSYIENITHPLLLQSYAILFLTSFALCIVIIISSGYGFNRRAVLDEVAVQSAHKGFVPRVGGLAIYLSIIAFIPISNFGFIPVSFVLNLNIGEMAWIILSASPVFIVGLSEDLGYKMSPSRRLLASVISGSLVIIIFKVWVNYVGIPGLDFLLSFAPIGIAFTLFATAGVVNAFNLIDGLNGLSSYATISTSFALSIVAFQAGNSQLSLFLVLISSAIMGFTLLNFPLAKIFLGDAGAYTLGHLIVWSAVLLVNFEPAISPYAILLIFFWPVADTGLAIWRRWKLGNPTGRPDRLHFHQLAMRFLEIRFLGRDQRQIANPLATVVIIPLISTPQVLGVLFWHDVPLTIWSTVLASFIFVITYFLGIKFAKEGLRN